MNKRCTGRLKAAEVLLEGLYALNYGSRVSNGFLQPLAHDFVLRSERRAGCEQMLDLKLNIETISAHQFAFGWLQFANPN